MRRLKTSCLSYNSIEGSEMVTGSCTVGRGQSELQVLRKRERDSFLCPSESCSQQLATDCPRAGVLGRESTLSHWGIIPPTSLVWGKSTFQKDGR